MNMNGRYMYQDKIITCWCVVKLKHNKKINVMS